MTGAEQSHDVDDRDGDHRGVDRPGPTQQAQDEQGLDQPGLRSTFAGLYDAHAPELLSWLQARTYSAEVAADLCAETFAVALEQIGRFDPSRGAPGAWLFGIARNLLRHYHRTAAVDHRARTRLAIVTPMVTEDDLDLVDDESDRARIAHLASAALDTLSPKLAAAVRSRVIEDKPYSEVAEECGCSQAAARARVSRGLSAMWDSLERLEAERVGTDRVADEIPADQILLGKVIR